MLDDIADAAQWAVSKNITRKRKICLWGISYGAYAAVQTVIRYPRLFQCAAGFGGVYDWSTFLDEGDSRGNPWSKRYWKWKLPVSKNDQLQQSPMTHIDQLQRNVLIMHGKKDVRCSVNQARRLKNQLEKHQKPHSYKAVSYTHLTLPTKA